MTRRKRGSLALRGWESTAGEKSRQAKMTDARVRVVKRGSLPSVKVAAVLKVSKSTINDVRAGRRWGHVEV
ncbi:hypothetical protein [Stieleria sp.]|uniref:hypothetical protein n=1 Tax=Stieleria sp. TaxID=2795976 RepID=UPI00356AE068